VWAAVCRSQTTSARRTLRRLPTTVKDKCQRIFWRFFLQKSPQERGVRILSRLQRDGLTSPTSKPRFTGKLPCLLPIFPNAYFLCNRYLDIRP